MLRYEDPDGDMISLNADDELEEALRLCGDGKTLKMTLTAAQRSVQQEEHSVDACALSNVFEENSAAVQAVVDLRSPSSRSSRKSASSESGDFEMVESYSRPSSVSVGPPVQPSELLRESPADEQDDALQAALKASIEEENARVAREAARMVAEAEAARMVAEAEAARIAAEAEAARIAAEAEAARIAAEAEAARIAAETEAERVAAEAEAERVAAEAEAERVAAEAEAERVAADAEAERVAEACRLAEEEARRAAVELAEKIAAEDEEKRARLEIAFAAAEEDALRRADELFSMGCSVDQIRSLYGESILMQLRLIPRMSDVHQSVPPVPEPVVDWEASKAVAEQAEEDRFPSQEQAAIVDEVGELAARLTAFYFQYNPAMLDTVAEVSRKFVGKEQDLNDALMRKYKTDLKSMVTEQLAAQEVRDEGSVAAARSSISSIPPLDEPDNALPARPTTPASEACPMSEETQDAVNNLVSMGFTDRAKNLELLQKHKNNVERVVNELFDA
jgi:hypothetical protein